MHLKEVAGSEVVPGRLAALSGDRWRQLLTTASERAGACTPAGDSRRHARTHVKRDPDGQQLKENHTRRWYLAYSSSFCFKHAVLIFEGNKSGCFLALWRFLRIVTLSPQVQGNIWGGKQAYFSTCGSGFPLSFFSFSLELSIINGWFKVA